MRPRKYNGDPNEHGDQDQTVSQPKRTHGGDPPRKERNRDDHDARGGKRKKRKRDPTPPPTVVDNPSAAHEEKSKKRKHKKRRSHDNAVEAPPQTGDHKSDFLSFDPSSDASLTEQNCKALSYAYQRFHAPSLWKFNKAKQNWLIRNIWSEQAAS
ncbi:hypothetical protein SCLCIDRAFT_20862 [Scleroderma citrinum Foug A]|uniref:WKF domain-containing protein n=1 Tax=Scleroderma citrinum Foug A TaxID=1036808 RepID=A0A0C3EIX5_9AGAM|nr:hypothetical protein SCLCIDRAFT_20862 [Scleroderma citrinum Foug A]